MAAPIRNEAVRVQSSKRTSDTPSAHSMFRNASNVFPINDSKASKALVASKDPWWGLCQSHPILATVQKKCKAKKGSRTILSQGLAERSLPKMVCLFFQRFTKNHQGYDVGWVEKIIIHSDPDSTWNKWISLPGFLVFPTHCPYKSYKQYSRKNISSWSDG